MRGNDLTKYTSARVEGFAIYCLQKMCCQIGYTEVNDDEARIIVNACDLRQAMSKIKQYASTKHQGKFGLIDSDSQKKLNLKLAMYDILGKPVSEKTALIGRIIREHDNLVKKKKKLELEQDFIKELVSDSKEFSANFRWIIRKVDNIYTIRKSSLRRGIGEDEKFEQACQILTDIFRRHIQRAMDLASEKYANNTGCGSANLTGS